MVSYPLVETVHKDNICHVTEAPADVPSSMASAAKRVAEKAISCLDGAGIFGVEMFALADGSVLLNEVAPRPHNSGHYTMDGCVTSQFENHVRAVMGWPLGDTSLTRYDTTSVPPPHRLHTASTPPPHQPGRHHAQPAGRERRRAGRQDGARADGQGVRDRGRQGALVRQERRHEEGAQGTELGSKEGRITLFAQLAGQNA